MLRSGKPGMFLASTVTNPPLEPNRNPSTSGNIIPATEVSLPRILYVPTLILTFDIVSPVSLLEGRANRSLS